MTTYRMISRPKSSILTMEFDYYNEAVAFCQQSSALSPSKPFRGLDLKWHVALPRQPEKAQFVKVEEWCKPFPGYDEWKGVEGLYHLPVYVPQPKVKCQPVLA